MPAIKPEIDGALEEGVEIEYLTAPVEVLQKDGVAVGLRCIRMDLGEPDASGRPRPVPRAGLGIRPGSRPPSSPPSARNLASTVWTCGGKGPWIPAEGAQVPGMEGVFAGGDAVELGLVTIAIAQGRFAAEAIDAWIQGKPLEKPARRQPIGADRVKLDWYKPAERARAQSCSAVAERVGRHRNPGGIARSGSARRSQAVHVLRHVHGLRNLLDVLHQQLLRQAAEGRALQSQAGAVQRLQEVRRSVPLRLYRTELRRMRTGGIRKCLYLKSTIIPTR